MDNEISKGDLLNLTLDLPYVPDPIGFYQKYKSKASSLLLMSAEVSSKKKQKSLILLESSLKIIATEKKVSLYALNLNGQNLLSGIGEKFNKIYNCEQTESKINILFNASSSHEHHDEDKRLKEIGYLSPLRDFISSINCLGDDQDLFIGGHLSFDFYETFEKLPKVSKGLTHCPYYTFFVSELLAEIDHESKKTKLKGSLFGGRHYANCRTSMTKKIGMIQQGLSYHGRPPQLFKGIKNKKNKFNVDTSDQDFENKVKLIKDKITKGDIFQAVLSRTFSMACHDSLGSFSRLVELNPSPYMFFMEDEEFTLFGASPESALKYNSEHRKVEVYPIAGTRKRGRDENGDIDRDKDGRIELELRMNEKEVAEHMMLVDLARNDVAKISISGSRFVEPLMKVDKYNRVMHLVSQVQGTLREDLDALHAYQATMNMGTLTGAPKISATSIIRKLEKKDRGPYGGAIGYINGKGDMDTCIVIRSAFVKGGKAYVQAGAGIVYDSDPADETQETKDKAYSVLMALGASFEN